MRARDDVTHGLRAHDVASPRLEAPQQVAEPSAGFRVTARRMLATVLAGIAEFERDPISEQVESGLAAAKARGKRLGRRLGHRPKSDRFARRVLRAVEDGRSYRWIARDLGLSKTTVAAIVHRHRVASDGPEDPAANLQQGSSTAAV